MNSYLKLRLEHLLFISLATAAFLFYNNVGYDYFWHLKAGEYLSKQLMIPDNDPFSFTATDHAWVLHEWLFEVIIFQIYHLSGHYGVKLFITIIATVSIYITYRTAVTLSNQRSASIIIAAIGFIIFIQFSLPRPQVITYLLYSIYLSVMLRYTFHSSKTHLYWLPATMLLWVNMHGGYVVGLTLMAIILATNTLDGRLQRNDKHLKQQPPGPLVITFLLSLGASLLNPYGYHQWLYPIQVMSMSAANLISEWLSPNFHLPLNKLYLIFIFGFFFLRIYSVSRPTMSNTVPPFFFIAMSLISIRHIPIATLTLIPYYVIALPVTIFHKGINAFATTRWVYHKFRSLNSGSQLGNWEYLLNWIALAALMTIAVVVHSNSPQRLSLYDNKLVPVQAVNFIERNNLSGNLFNDYSYGGYLLFKLYPKCRVFIDGRADLYGDKFLDEYKTIYQTNPGWEKLFYSYPVDIILIKKQAPLALRLQQSAKFRLIYRDQTNLILIRNKNKYRTIIDKYAL